MFKKSKYLIVILASLILSCKTIPKIEVPELISKELPVVKHRFKTSERIQYTPIFNNNVAYCNNLHGIIYAFDLVKDTLIWKHYGKGGLQYGFREGLVWGNGIVVVPTESRIIGLDPLTGEKKWSIEQEYVRERFVTVTDSTLFTCSKRGDFYAYNVSSGKLKWQADLKYSPTTEPLIENGVAYVGNASSYYAFDISTGVKLWQSSLGYKPVAKAVCDSNYLYLALSSKIEGPENVFNYYNYFYALDIKTGKKKWDVEVKERLTSVLAIRDNMFYYKTENKQLHAFDLSTKENKWTIDVEKYCLKLFIKDEKLIFADNGSVTAINRQVGETIWKYTEVNPIWKKGLNISGDLLVFNKNGVTIEALHINSGDRVWALPVVKISSLSEPVVVGRKIVFAGNRYLYVAE